MPSDASSSSSRDSSIERENSSSESASPKKKFNLTRHNANLDKAALPDNKQPKAGESKGVLGKRTNRSELSLDDTGEEINPEVLQRGRERERRRLRMTHIEYSEYEEAKKEKDQMIARCTELTNQIESTKTALTQPNTIEQFSQEDAEQAKKSFLDQANDKMHTYELNMNMDNQAFWKKAQEITEEWIRERHDEGIGILGSQGDYLDKGYNFENYNHSIYDSSRHTEKLHELRIKSVINSLNNNISEIDTIVKYISPHIENEHYPLVSRTMENVLNHMDTFEKIANDSLPKDFREPSDSD